MTTRVLGGDCRDVLPTLCANSVHCVVTSPPYYGLRSYLDAAHPDKHREIGSEATPDDYVGALVVVFREVWRVLRDDGTLWLNIGDGYNNFRTQKGPGQAVHGRDELRGKPAPLSGRRGWDGLKEKDLLMIPARLALALQADGWFLRSDIIWSKPNPMPESVTDRPTSAHEHVFLLTKGPRYHYDADAVREAADQPDRVRADAFGGSSWQGRQQHSEGLVFTGSATRNLRNVWSIATAPYPGAHFATFPPALAERCIKAGCPKDGTVLDPFAGAGTTGLVADRLQRDAVLIELSPAYCAMLRNRITADAPLFAEVG